jgi:hypothetical protein
MSPASQVVLYRAAVKSVRRCLEIANEPPRQIDELCSGLLSIVETSNAEKALQQARRSYTRRLAEGEPSDLYFNAVFEALDKAKDEEDAELWVLQSVNTQLAARVPVPRASAQRRDAEL